MAQAQPGIDSLFPTELLNAVFLEFVSIQVIPLRNGCPQLGWCDESRARAPWILASVSSRWRKLVLVNPALWTYIGLRKQLLVRSYGASPSRGVSYVKDMVSRSADLPLEITIAWEGISWDKHFHGPILGALADAGDRWTDFSIGIPPSQWETPMMMWSYCSPLFYVLATRCMKNLKVLEVDLYLTLQVIWDFITYSPLLESLSLDIRHQTEQRWPGMMGTTLHARNLKSLALYNHAAQGLAALPRNFSFPALETLRGGFSSVDALAIVARAAPAVSALRLDVDASLTAADVQSLAILKKLQKLEVHHIGVHMGAGLFDGIAPDAWPALEEILIFGIDLQPGEADAVLRFVGARAIAAQVGERHLRVVVFRDCTGVVQLQAQVNQLLAA